MADTARREPFIWVTWLTGLLAGDDQCAWKAWFKAHYQYEKRPDDNENDLSVWKANHAVRVRATAARFAADGWTVTTEDQNKIRVRGKTAMISAAPDIIATNDEDAMVVDWKTGQRRDKDYWQVVIYLLMLKIEGRLGSRDVIGKLLYMDGERTITMSEAESQQSRVFQIIRDTGSRDQTLRVPSASECSRCDIASCPDRVIADTRAVDTEAF